MIPFEELSRPGRLRRMRSLAEAALQAFGMADAQIAFLRESGNTLFRVYETKTFPASEVYLPGQYLLRIHQPGYQSGASIELELAWLHSMCVEEALPVPEPIAAQDGRWLAQVSTEGIPDGRHCSLLRWVKGRSVKNRTRPHHYRAQGQLMAKLHNHAAHWKAPAGLSKRKYDWDGLFGDEGGFGIPAGKAWSRLPKKFLPPYEAITRQVKQVMGNWKTRPEMYGLIHADLGMDANLLFSGGTARAIDFDDSGYGYYLYDLSLALEHCQEDRRLPEFRQALLEGYGQYRSLPARPEKYLDLFLSAFCVYLSLWCTGMAVSHPQHRGELFQRRERALQIVRRLESVREF